MHIPGLFILSASSPWTIMHYHHVVTQRLDAEISKQVRCWTYHHNNCFQCDLYSSFSYSSSFLYFTPHITGFLIPQGPFSQHHVIYTGTCAVPKLLCISKVLRPSKREDRIFFFVFEAGRSPVHGNICHRPKSQNSPCRVASQACHNPGSIR